jgi:hypothetical protein
MAGQASPALVPRSHAGSLQPTTSLVKGKVVRRENDMNERPLTPQTNSAGRWTKETLNEGGSHDSLR